MCVINWLTQSQPYLWVLTTTQTHQASGCKHQPLWMELTCQFNATTLQHATNRLVWCLIRKVWQQQDVQHIYIHIYLPTTNTKKENAQTGDKCPKTVSKKIHTHYSSWATPLVVLYTIKLKNRNHRQTIKKCVGLQWCERLIDWHKRDHTRKVTTTILMY